MKKLLILILSLSMATVAFASCGGGGDDSVASVPASSIEESVSSEVEEKTFTVTFKQDGVVVKTVEVKEGGAVAASDIPATTSKTGYTVVWETVALENITADIEVKAVSTANTYTITFDVDGGEAVAPMTVTYDSNVTLPTPVRAGYNFIAWVDAGNNAVTNGKWTTASNATLKATWSEVIPDMYTISFVQGGQDVKTERVEKGTNYTNIPTPAAKTGYTVEWDPIALAKLSNVQEDVVVNLVETPITYTVTFVDVDGKTLGTQEVTYDAAYELVAPTAPTGHDFDKFTVNGEAFATSGTWKNSDVTTIVVNWVAKTYTISLKVGSNGTCEKTEITVTYDEAYTLPKVTVKDGYVFAGWKLNGEKIDSTGTWKYAAAGTIELVASIQTEEWTKNY